MKTINTKKALIASLLSLVLCVSMLVGSTFAWFTDTATTSVNTIQAGKLQVDIVDGAGASLKGKSMSFVDKDGSADILWEPGATFRTIGFKVKNIGNLSFKYKMVLNGVDGNNELLDVITFKVVKADGTTVDLSTFEGHLKKDDVSDLLYIEGHMDETAGNKYQDMKLEGIGITVYATQDTVENDSNGNTYDDGAAYTEVIDAGKTFTGKQTLDVGVTATDANAIAVKAIGADADVTITDGIYDGGNGGNNICVAAANGAKVTIKGGTFTVGGDADGYGNSVVYSENGNIVIEGGFFYTNYSYGGRYYVLNQSNSKPGTITVKGGTFVNYDPSKGDDNLGGNFVAEGYMVVAQKQANGDIWYTVVESSKLQEVLKEGGVVTVFTDIETGNSADTSDARVIIKNPTTLNLNAKIISPDDMGNNSTNFVALIVDADTTINADENGGINTGTNGGYALNVRNGATLTINGGSYYGGGTTVQVQKGTLIINGGTFACEPFGAPYYTNFLLNCVDAAYKNGTAKIIVKGGTFVNFDPSNNSAEGAGTNFVADGYKVTSETKDNGEVWYTVVPE